MTNLRRFISLESQEYNMLSSDITVTLSAFLSSVSIYLLTNINLLIIWMVVSPLFFLFIHRKITAFTKSLKLDLLYFFFLSTLIFVLAVWYIYSPYLLYGSILGLIILIGSIPLFNETKEAISKELRV